MEKYIQKSVLFLALTALFSMPLFAQAISTTDAIRIGQELLARTYGVSIDTVKPMQADDGGVQMVREADGFRIWYWPPVQPKKTRAHVVTVNDQGIAQEANKEIFASITSAQAEATFKNHLQNAGLIIPGQPAYTRQIGTILGGTRSYSSREKNILGSQEAVERALQGNPGMVINLYTPSAIRSDATEYTHYDGVIDAINGTVLGMKKGNVCAFGVLRTESDAVNAVQRKTGSIATKAYLDHDKCVWNVVVPGAEGTYIISDNDALQFQALNFPATPAPTVSTPATPTTKAQPQVKPQTKAPTPTMQKTAPDAPGVIIVPANPTEQKRPGFFSRFFGWLFR